MGFDSNGNWSSDFFPVTDRDNSVPILASKFQTLIQTNLKQSFENCILRDGTGKPTANINFNSQKITNLADGTNSNDAVNKSQLDSAVAVSAGEEQQGTIEIATEAEALAGTDDTTAMTPAKVKAVIDTLATSTRFCANSGNAATGTGVPSLISSSTGSTYLDFNNISSENPLVCTTASGNSFTITEISSVDISGYASGTYNLFVDSNSQLYVYANKIYRQSVQPSEMNTNDVWLDTREPFKAYIKTLSDLEETGIVPLPQNVTISSNQISSVNTLCKYNDNLVVNNVVGIYKELTPGLAPFSIGEDISWNTEYTFPDNGYVILTYSGNYNWETTVSITPGFTVGIPNHYTGILPVFKGQKIKVYGERTPSAGDYFCQFHRCIGFSGITL